MSPPNTLSLSADLLHEHHRTSAVAGAIHHNLRRQRRRRSAPRLSLHRLALSLRILDIVADRLLDDLSKPL